MAAFNPFFVDEMIVPEEPGQNYFGLIPPDSGSENGTDRSELHGYEVTMSGRIVLPRLHPQPEEESLRLKIAA